MKVSDFDYNLPKELIAQYPVKERGTSNLLVLDRETGKILHKKYFNVVDYFEAGDVLILNKTKVINARLFPVVERTGRKVEVLLLNKIPSSNSNCSERQNLARSSLSSSTWYALVGRAKHVRIGDRLIIGDFSIDVSERNPGQAGFVLTSDNFEEIVKKYGHVPLPAYINRKDEPSDKVRYNTVFSQQEGSVAAPTASLNVTNELLEKIKSKGVQIVYVNLVVGWGTFAIVNTTEVEDFKIHEEYIEIPKETAVAVNSCKNRVWAFGTTVVRAIESVADMDHKIKAFSGYTNIYIYPGYKFKAVDVLLTNFHAPMSSLIMLVSAFAGKQLIDEVYNSAIKRKYSFLSYGDSMLIL
ncbi:tRNA preQ1(34) S-adenosylmethionine ribosyltransferase-isomerase QueA [Candidatus Dojkabacteria bacterium]|nr:tRNA preQ1(34) S-adenosylmethionine ribosyltransferase-isomerase QueA [Candidatus Dojkabacteria bacterium]